MTIFFEKSIKADQSDWRQDQRRDTSRANREIGPTEYQTLSANFLSGWRRAGWGKNHPIWAITRADYCNSDRQPN